MTKPLLILSLFSGAVCNAQTLGSPTFETALSVAWTDLTEDPCQTHRPQFGSVLSGRMEANHTRSLASGARISGELSQPTGLNQASVVKILGAPSSTGSTSIGETKLSYKYAGCLGEVVLDQQGIVVSAILIPTTPIPTAVSSGAKFDLSESREQKQQPTTERPSAIPNIASPLQKPEAQISGGSRAKKIMMWTLLTVGTGAAWYYGYNSRRSGGNCNVPSDIAADGSRCGDRAASVRPGGRP